MMVARHFSAGFPIQNGVSPVGTIETAFRKALKRPYASVFPGTEVPGYLHFVPTEQTECDVCRGFRLIVGLSP
jgi:hypothetical protein